MDDFTNGGDNLRDASFSYLRSEQSSTRKSTSNRKIKYDHHHQDQGEISVFGAERYFNMSIEDEKAINTPIRKQADHHGGVGGGGGGDDGAKSVNYQPGTPSGCSEMSWNSRSALLLRASTNNSMASSGNPSRSRKRRVFINGRRGIFATLACAGACSDEKSVHVEHHHQGREEGQAHHDVVVKKINDEQAGNLSQQPSRLPVQPRDDHDDFLYAARSTKRSEDHFAFPILSSATTTDENKKNSVISTSSDHNLQLQHDLQEPPRMSLEVFGSKTTSKAAAAADEVAINLERKLSVLTWDAIPTKPQKRVPPKAAATVAAAAAGNGRPAHHDQDMDSDASSDLFEIENITVGSTTSRSLQLVSDVDNISRCATPNHNLQGSYEPSEASIEWSVVTASAADLGSIVSDYDEKKISANSSTRRLKASKSGGGILGCKSQKSVRVAESTYRNTSSTTTTAAKEIMKSSNV